MIPHPYRSNTSSVSTPYTAQCCVTQFIHYITHYTNGLSPNKRSNNSKFQQTWCVLMSPHQSVIYQFSHEAVTGTVIGSSLAPMIRDVWNMISNLNMGGVWCCLLLLTVIQKFTFYSELFRILIHLSLNYFSLATHKALSFMCQRFQSTLAINA